MLKLPDKADLVIATLGEAAVPSPLKGQRDAFVSSTNGVLIGREIGEQQEFIERGESPPCFEAAGPRERIFFEPASTSCGIVTCGGLCPGLNDVIRSIVLTLTHAYGVRRVLGFRYGYFGTVIGASTAEPIELDSRDGGEHPSARGDAARHLPGPAGRRRHGRPAGEARPSGPVHDRRRRHLARRLGPGRGDRPRRGLSIGVIGVPKTIDNDLLWTQRTFGFAYRRGGGTVGLGRGAQRSPGGVERYRTGQADGAPHRLDRDPRDAGRRRRQLLSHPGGPLHSRGEGRLPRAARGPPRRSPPRRRRGRRGRRAGADRVPRRRGAGRVRQRQAQGHRRLPAATDPRALLLPRHARSTSSTSIPAT